MLKRVLFLTLLLLSLPFVSEAATEFVCTINKTGEDYNTLSLWEAAMDDAGDLTDGTVKTGDWDNQSGSDIADATTVTWDGGSSEGTLIHMTGTQYLIDITAGSLADNDTVSDGTNTFDVNGTPDSTIIVAECYDDDGQLDETASTISVSGFTTSGTNYVEIRAASGERHDGTTSGAGASGTGFEVKVNDQGDDGFSVDNYNIHIKWIKIDGSGLYDYGAAIKIDYYKYDCLIDNVIIHSLVYNQFFPSYGLCLRGNDTIVKNVIIEGDPNDAVRSDDFTSYLYGVTIESDHDGFTGDSTTIYKNCVAIGSGTNWNIGDIAHADSTNNASEDDTADDDADMSNSIINITPADEFADYSNGDFHLKSTSSDLKDGGADLYGTVNTDIDGDTLTVRDDIGADEYVSAVTAAGQIMKLNIY